MFRVSWSLMNQLYIPVCSGYPVAWWIRSISLYVLGILEIDESALYPWLFRVSCSLMNQLYISLYVQGNLELDESLNSVLCTPNIKKKGTAIESFTILDKNVTVEHWVKKGVDTIITTTITGREHTVRTWKLGNRKTTVRLKLWFK